MLARLRVMSFAARDLLWKCALVGPLFSATAHSLVVSLPSDAALDVAPMVAAAADPAPAAVERAVVGADAALSVRTAAR